MLSAQAQFHSFRTTSDRFRAGSESIILSIGSRSVLTNSDFALDFLDLLFFQVPTSNTVPASHRGPGFRLLRSVKPEQFSGIDCR